MDLVVEIGIRIIYLCICDSIKNAVLYYNFLVLMDIFRGISMNDLWLNIFFISNLKEFL